MAPSGRRCESLPRRSAESGFSLMEILLALFLLVIIVTAVTRTFRNARYVQEGSYYVEQASSFAQGKMGQLAAASLQSVTPGVDTLKVPLGPSYIRSWTMVDHGATKEVDVTVTWTLSGKSHGVKLGTILK